MRYLYLVVAMVLMGCSSKESNVEVATQTQSKIEVVEVAKVEESKKAQPKLKLNPNETLIEEPMVTKPIAPDVPAACVKWSDGCNVCTRKGGGKAICTTNPECKHKIFSCLQWQ